MTSRTTVLTASALLAALLATLAASCADGDDAPQRVVVIGDSITGLVADDLAAMGEEPFDYVLRATNGATSREMLAVADDLPDLDADQVIVELGTNDVLGDLTPSETASAIGEIVGLYPDASCIHLTTVNEHVISLEDPSINDRIAEINDGLERLAAADERVSIIDWSSFVGGYLDAGEPDGSLLTDTVHPTALGQRKLLELYVEALRGCDR